MAKKRVVCVVGTRPEVIKVAPVIRELRRKKGLFKTQVLVTAQHREMLDQMLAVFSIQPDLDFDIMRPGQAPAEVARAVLQKMSEFLEAERPAVVLAEGDTTTVMATAVACFFAGIPFGHIEAGLRTGNLQAPYPEEFNRRVADLVARYHFAPTARAAGNLVREGVTRDTIFVTGNTVIDALRYVLETTPAPPKPVPAGRPYVLMTCHRREIFGEKIREVFQAVRDFARARPEVTVWYPVHPNPEVEGPARAILQRVSNVRLTEPLDYVAFAHAMNDAYLLLTDSGGIQEEAPALGKPVLVLRDETERPEGVEAGACLLVGPHKDRITQALRQMFENRALYARMAQPRYLFGDGHAAERIVAALAAEGAERTRSRRVRVRKGAP